MKNFLLLLCLLFLPIVVEAKKSNDPLAYQWAYNHIGAYEAWDQATGSRNVVVAVLDNGFDSFHPDLVGNVWQNEDEIADNNLDDDRNGYVDDVWGWNFFDNNNNPRVEVDNLSEEERQLGVVNHATIVAGLIGAQGDNGLDGVGLNWQVKLMNVKVLGNSGNGSFGNFAEAVRYAADNGADIINISIVSGSLDEEITAALKYAFQKGILIVAAAGNDSADLNQRPAYPVCLDVVDKDIFIFGVNAINQDHHLALFSNYGSKCIDLTAPGQGLNSTVRFSPANGLNERYGENWHGTSFATPLVSGAAALIKSIQPAWGPKEISFALTSTVHHTPGQDETIYANLFGAGLLQVDKAVAYAVSQLKNRQEINHIDIFDSTSGMTQAYDVLKNNRASHKNSALLGIDKVVSFQQDGLTYFATAKYAGHGVEIKIFDSEWRELNVWSATASGSMDLAISDIRGDAEPEVVLAPQHASRQVYGVYSLAGAFIEEKLGDVELGGVKLAVLGKKIFIFHKGEIKEFENNKLVKKINIALNSASGFGVGDVDGDGQEEYILSPEAGNLPYLFFYNQAGELGRKFLAYDTTYIGGLNLQVGDYDRNKTAEVIVAPISGSLPARVWSGRVKKLVEWPLFFITGVKKIGILVY